MNGRERYWQAAMNLIHTNGLNDSKDFNNLGYFRRNTKKEFILDFETFSKEANLDDDSSFGKKRMLLMAKKREFNNIDLLSIIVTRKEQLLYQKDKFGSENMIEI